MFAASLLRAAAIRRLPMWLLVLLPWCVLRSVPGMLLALAFIVADFLLLRRKVTRRWAAWMDAALPEFEDSSALLAR
ncbi:MAG: hypothetical protein JF619_29985, partial [Massilia sp.]|nr:hypothetical protein [Massilia sp.]